MVPPAEELRVRINKMQRPVRLSSLLRGEVKSAEFRHDFVAQAIKAPVGHDEQEIARFGFGPKILGNGVGTGKHASVLAKCAHTFCNSLRLQAILSSQLLGAKNAPKNDA